MNQKQWNVAMFSALTALAVIAVPFFALAQGLDFGGFSNADFGGFSNMDFGGSSSLDFGGFSINQFGGSSSLDFGGANGAGSVSGTSGLQSTGSSSSGSPGFDVFSGDLGPFTNTPGNPQGTDTMPNPDPDGDGCIVNCNPGSTTPTPTPIPNPTGNPSSSTSKDTIRIFIHQIFLHDPFDHLPGDQVPLRITFENTGTKNLDDTKVIVTIPDLGGVRATVGPFDLNRGRTMTKTLVLELPEDVQPGTYPLRLQVYNEATQRIIHREVEVIDYS